jgi:hypothetical protein
VFVFAQSAEITGHVTGDVIAFARSVRLSGQVDGNIRAMNNSLTITGTVNKNVLMFAESLDVDGSGKIGGSLIGFMTGASVDGGVGGDILLLDHNTSINGKVGGSIRARGETFVAGPHAEVSGHTRYEGEKPAEVSQEAKLAYPLEYTKAEHTREHMATSYVWQGIWAAAFILFGLVLFLLMPGFMNQAVADSERYGASFGLGVLVMFGVPIAALIACVTVVGLFIGISTLFIWYASLYVAQVVVGGLVGQWVMGRTSEQWPLIGRMIVGLLLVRLATIAPVVGGWVKFAVVLWGLGAISLTVYRRLAPVVTPPSSPLATPYVPPLPPNTTVGGFQSA